MKTRPSEPGAVSKLMGTRVTPSSLRGARRARAAAASDVSTQFPTILILSAQVEWCSADCVRKGGWGHGEVCVSHDADFSFYDLPSTTLILIPCSMLTSQL